MRCDGSYIESDWDCFCPVLTTVFFARLRMGIEEKEDDRGWEIKVSDLGL